MFGNRIQEAFEALKTPCYRTFSMVTRGCRCGRNPWQQHHHKARDALRSATKGERTFTSIWESGNMMKSTGNLSSHMNWVGLMGHAFGSHRAVRHKPQCTALAKRKVCESDSFTKSWLEQAGGIIMEETRVHGRKKRTGKSSNVRRSSTSFSHSGQFCWSCCYL